jgi:ketosteroid isomerase-like protein
MVSRIIKRTLFSLLFFSIFALPAGAQNRSGSKERAIVTAMKNSENDWNKGDLNGFMRMYIGTSTMMLPTGPAGIGAIRDLYQRKYFNGKMPKQHLYYDEMKVTLLGENYALLTGKFTLSGNKLPERSGRYSLVMIQTKEGWKILHDHSS